MTLQPPDPYALKAVETATKTIVELLHEDIKAGLAELIRVVKERGREQAIQNADAFGKVLENEMSQRISIGVSPDGYERIEGNLNDPDFAYLVRQATVASARTANHDKHRLLARAVTERLFAKPEGLVALASSLACEIIPNLTPRQLSFLGLLSTVLSIRPTYSIEEQQSDPQHQQQLYISWLESELSHFRPYPTMRDVDYDHLQGMSCIDIMRVGRRNWNALFNPRDLPKFTWPEGYLDNNESIRELKQIDGLARCTPTTVGSVIGTHVHDIRLNSTPTIFMWDKED